MPPALAVRPGAVTPGAGNARHSYQRALFHNETSYTERTGSITVGAAACCRRAHQFRPVAGGYQPTATTMYCGLLTEMSEDCPASSSYGNPYCSPLIAFWCQN